MQRLTMFPIRTFALTTAALSLSSIVQAQTYTAKAGESVAALNSVSISSTPTEAFWDGTWTHSVRNAWSRADQGALSANTLCTTDAQYNMAAYGVAEIEFDDLVFSSADSGTIPVVLHLSIAGNSSVVNGNSFSVVLREGSQQIGTASKGVSGVVSSAGLLSGWDMSSAFAIDRAKTVSLNTPVNLKLKMTIMAAASGGGHNSNGHYTLRFGGTAPIPPSCDQYELFSLPAGVTVNSLQAGISNNLWSEPSPGTNYCDAGVNSVSSAGAQIFASGSAEVSANDLVLTAGPIPPGQPGLFFHGASQVQLPFGEGFLCTGNGIVRVNPASVADSAGYVTRAFDTTAGAGVTAGTSRNFQLWYRDPLAGDLNGDGSADDFNLSDALQVCFY